MRKPTMCIGKNKDADQLRGNREADQAPLLGKYNPSSFYSFNPSMYYSIAITVMEKFHVDIHPRKKEVRF